MLETDRLYIRIIKHKDIDDVFEYVGNPEVMKYEKEQYETKDKFYNLIDYFIEHKSMFVAILKENSKVIGQVYLGKTNPTFNNEYNLGYIFNPNYHSKGYCTEACKALLNYGFNDLKVNRIRAACNPENTASWKVMEKLGMTKEAHFKKRVHFRDDDLGNPIYTDEFVYAMNISEWKK